MNARRTHLTALRLFLCSIFLGLAGCSAALEGNWKTDSPPKNSDSFVKSVQFNKDGTFVMVEKKEDENKRLAGTWDFNGFKLTLKSPGKESRVYNATYIMGGTLNLKQGEEKLTLKKQ